MTILVAAYHLNGDFLPAADVIPSNYAASSLFEEGDLSFTHAEMPFMFRSWASRGQHGASTDKEGRALSKQGEHYYLVPSRREGTFVNTFGPGPTLVAAPVFGALRLLNGTLRNHPRSLWYGGKLAASLCVAGSAVFVFLAALLFTRTRRAFLIALAYGLGTCVWAISSQALWQHGPNELFLAMGTYFLLRSHEQGKFAVLCGAALSCAVCSRPSSAVVVVVFGAYLLWTNRRSALLFIAGGAPLALALLGYNLYHFGSPFLTGQGIRGPSVALAKTGSAAIWQTPLWKGAAGLLVSPSRGLLVFSPFVVFAIWGLIRAWRNKAQYGPLRAVTLALAALCFMQFKWFDWWGGHCFGYRPLVDGMPLLVLLLALVIDDIRAKPVLTALFGALLVWSVGVQVIGAFAYNERDWNTQRTEVRPVSRSNSNTISYNMPYTHRPENIDNKAFRYRLWSIRDSQLAHYLRFFRPARRFKKTLMLARLAIAFVPAVPAVVQTACSPPVSKTSDVQGVIKIGSPQAHEFLGSGWSIGDETIDGRDTRWAVGGRTRIQVSLPPSPGDRRLAFVAKPMLGPTAQRVTVLVNGHVVGRASMSIRWKTYAFLVPEKLFKVGRNEIDFKHDWCMQPSMIDPRSRDQRRLAALYDEISLGPLGPLPRTMDFNLGTSMARDKLLLQGGGDGQERQGGHTFVRSPGPSPSFRFPLALKGAHYLLTLEARVDASEGAASAINVELNGKVVGKLELGPSWAMRSLPIDAGRFVAGINTLKFIPTSLSQPDALLSRIAIRPVSTSHDVDLGTPAAREHLLSGWGKDEVHAGRTAVWSVGAASALRLQIHAVGGDYRLQLTARAFEPTLPQKIAVSINKNHVGSIELSQKWATRSLVVPRRLLVDGLNDVFFSYSKTVAPAVAKPDWVDTRELAILVDRVALRPASASK